MPNHKETSGFAARAAVLKLLRGVLRNREQLSDLTGPDGALAELSPADRARAQRLTAQVLRHMGRADAMLEAHVDRLPPVQVLNILRLATVELCEEHSAAHGVVDSAVSLARRGGQTRKFAGLVNAVLRKIAVEGAEHWTNLPPQKLPQWLRRRLVHIYDETTTLGIEAAHAAAAPLDITPKGDGTLPEGDLLPTGSLRLDKPGQLTGLPGYEAGDWWVQDAGAALAARLLAPQKGELILDMCAAPGGKTMQLAATGAHVTALDVSKSRMVRVRENLARTGLRADCVVADGLSWQPEVQFDAILLDAPCSATGTIRRHPDLPFIKNGKDLHALFELQAELIDRAVSMLRPGGRLVFCTCSLLTEEGELQAKSAVARHALEVLSVPHEALGIPDAWGHPGGGLRLRPDFWPERGGIDGFFMIALRKPQ